MDENKNTNPNTQEIENQIETSLKEATEISDAIDQTNQDTLNSLSQIEADVAKIDNEVDAIGKDLQDIETKAGDELDTLMMQYAEYTETDV